MLCYIASILLTASAIMERRHGRVVILSATIKNLLAADMANCPLSAKANAILRL